MRAARTADTRASAAEALAHAALAAEVGAAAMGAAAAPSSVGGGGGRRKAWSTALLGLGRVAWAAGDPVLAEAMLSEANVLDNQVCVCCAANTTVCVCVCSALPLIKAGPCLSPSSPFCVHVQSPVVWAWLAFVCLSVEPMRDREAAAAIDQAFQLVRVRVGSGLGRAWPQCCRCASAGGSCTWATSKSIVRRA